MVSIAKQIVIEKSAVITFDNVVDEMAFRRYLKGHWKDLTLGLKDATILFLAGVHGSNSGELGPNENIQTLKNQFKPEVLAADWLLEDMEKRSIKIEFLNVPDFFLNKKTRQINEKALVSEIQKTNPQIIIMMICYSNFLDLKSLLERVGLFPALRMNQDLNILSNGQILTMNDVQKEFIQTMALEKHVEKDVVVTGPVGSGKTLLGLEAINIKKSHYKKKYGISSIDCKNKLRIIIMIQTNYFWYPTEYDNYGPRTDSEVNMLKKQLEMIESHKDCSLDIETSTLRQDNDISVKDASKLTRIFRADKNYKSYKHTIIMMDEVSRHSMVKVKAVDLVKVNDRYRLEEHKNVDYIYCLQYGDSEAVQTKFKPLEVTKTTISCNLHQRQRSSQQILDLADYLRMHNTWSNTSIGRWDSPKSFSNDIPLWVEIASPPKMLGYQRNPPDPWSTNLFKSFVEYFYDKFEPKDVMLIYCRNPPNLYDIENICKEQKWRCTDEKHITGSEASVIILYNLFQFDYEAFTRAKTQLVIVTTLGSPSVSSDGKISYVLTKLQDIEKGNHNDEECEKYCKDYKALFGQKLPECQYKGNPNKIQSLIRKVQVNRDGNVTEVQLENKESNEEDIQVEPPENQETVGGSKSLGTRIKNFFRK